METKTFEIAVGPFVRNPFRRLLQKQWLFNKTVQVRFTEDKKLLYSNFKVVLEGNKESVKKVYDSIYSNLA